MTLRVLFFALSIVVISLPSEAQDSLDETELLLQELTNAHGVVGFFGRVAHYSSP